MKNLFKIHPFTYIFLFIALITGYFKEVIMFLTIIFIHELGHILTAVFLKWKIEKILILPLGGITIFNELINRPLIEEALITIMGPLFQIIFTIVINNNILHFYSKMLLFINLLPIYPLDGAKIMNIILNKVFSFKLSHKLTIYFSYLICVLVFIYNVLNKNLIMFLFALFLIFKLKDELSNHNMIFNKFLYERYLYNFDFKKVKIVENEIRFKRDYYHFIDDGFKIIDENTYLKNKYINLENKNNL